MQVIVLCVLNFRRVLFLIESFLVLRLFDCSLIAVLSSHACLVRANRLFGFSSSFRSCLVGTLLFNFLIAFRTSCFCLLAENWREHFSRFLSLRLPKMLTAVCNVHQSSLAFKEQIAHNGLVLNLLGHKFAFLL